MYEEGTYYNWWRRMEGAEGGLFVRAMQTASNYAYASGIPIRLGQLGKLRMRLAKLRQATC